ncbi:hypothetical protein [Actinoplanes sp. ATCC 53533]|uniref:hypothetical protein n=1 Tax=Actinoplanes sp. ATCC 53533 TaxID=1288362 RepID=UPI0013158B3E|nr:hypothetical protein [Actinoplanes sp. ATCC 53533]
MGRKLLGRALAALTLLAAGTFAPAPRPADAAAAQSASDSPLADRAGTSPPRIRP